MPTMNATAALQTIVRCRSLMPGSRGAPSPQNTTADWLRRRAPVPRSTCERRHPESTMRHVRRAALTDAPPAKEVMSASNATSHVANNTANAVAVPLASVTMAETRRLRNILCLDDFEPAARAHLPRPIFGYIAGAAETNASLADNRAAFAEWGFVPRMLIDVSRRSQQTTLFGHSYAAPFGIAPMGISALYA